MEVPWDIVEAVIINVQETSLWRGLNQLWALTFGALINLTLLGSNAERLSMDMEKLNEIMDDTMREVEREESENSSNMIRTRRVDGWMKRVDALRLQVEQFELSFSRRKIFLGGDYSARDWLASCNLGNQAADAQKLIREMKNERDGLRDLVSKLPPLGKVNLEKNKCHSLVGRQDELNAIMGYLEDDNVESVGIYGMCGVGKTTLLIKLNNYLYEKRENISFNVVIYVKATKEINILKIQKLIGQRLGLFLSETGVDMQQKAAEQATVLNRVLSRTKFLLLLDDVWETLKLENVGIPHLNTQNKSKIFLATQLEKICDSMKVSKKIKLHTLDETEARDLLLQEADAVNHNKIESFVKVVVSKCEGLPLALSHIGKIMRNREADSWKNVKEQLESSSSFQEIPDMDSIFRRMKSSFDALTDDRIKSCFLYCCLYDPDNQKIDKEELVYRLFGEGILDNQGDEIVDIGAACMRGYNLLEELQSACLLEISVSHNKDKHVKMHNVLRSFALWLTSGKNDETNKFLVHIQKGSSEVLVVERWENAKRISLMHGYTERLPNEIPKCSRLVTLSVDKSYLPSPTQIPCHLFSLMTSLRVLNLSGCFIYGVPDSIGCLQHLQYLNLSGTLIVSLPIKVTNLHNLRLLDLSSTDKLSRIPGNAISKLSKLEKLDLFKSRYDWGMRSGTPRQGDLGSPSREKQLCLKDLEGLLRLQELGISIRASMEYLKESQKILSLSIRKLSLQNISNFTTGDLCPTFEQLKNVKRLSLGNCKECKGEWVITGKAFTPSLEFLLISGLSLTGIVVVRSLRGSNSSGFPFQNLHELQIVCTKLKKLVGIGQLPSLEILRVSSSEEMEELVASDGGSECLVKDQEDFEKLKHLEVQRLPALRSITKYPLQLPSLEILKVEKCPLLKKLPFDSNGGKAIKEIKGGPKWWNALDWEDGSIRSRLETHFNGSEDTVEVSSQWYNCDG